MAAIVVSARSHRAAGRWRRAALIVVALAAIARLPKNRRAQEIAITVAIGLAAAAALARESNARSVARLAAWDQRHHPQNPDPAARG